MTSPMAESDCPVEGKEVIEDVLHRASLDASSEANVTCYEKIDHSRSNMILQYRVLYSTFFFLPFCESMVFSLLIHTFSAIRRYLATVTLGRKKGLSF